MKFDEQEYTVLLFNFISFLPQLLFLVSRHEQKRTKKQKKNNNKKRNDEAIVDEVSRVFIMKFICELCSNNSLSKSEVYFLVELKRINCLTLSKRTPCWITSSFFVCFSSMSHRFSLLYTRWLTSVKRKYQSECCIVVSYKNFVQ